MLRPSRGGFWLSLTLLGAATIWLTVHEDLELGLGLGLGFRDASAARPPERSLNSTAAALAEARNEKVRVQAALVLGRLRDPRAIPALTRALADRSALVRAVAAQILGEFGDLGAESARPALEVASHDPSAFVRRHAIAALERLTRVPAPRPVLEVRPMGDHTRRASPALREQMRRTVIAELAPLSQHLHQGIPLALPGGFTVDGAIRALEVKEGKREVEVRCDVQLILSTHPGQAMVLMSSGEATVQRPRGRFRSAMLREMQNDALEHAVRGAAEELRQHLTPRAPAPAPATATATAVASPAAKPSSEVGQGDAR